MRICHKFGLQVIQLNNISTSNDTTYFFYVPENYFGNQIIQ